MKKLTTVAAIAAALAIAWKRMNRNSLNNNSTSADTSGLSSKLGPSCTPPDYEVFLSFRGEDTRKEFVDHLYNRLNDAGVWVFRDNEGLRTGERIGPQLIKAIRASKLSIPVISTNYASSPWCFMELVEILEWKKNGQIVLPIFFRVTPSSVRHQTGKFGKAFSSHQKKYGSDDIQKWRNALNEVASLKGLESDKIADGHEGELVKIVLREVLKNLKKTNLVVSDHLIGVHDHKDKIIEMVNAKALGDARVILIHGMGGVGKTTLAKVVYNHFSPSYFYQCFLPNVRERSLNDRDKLNLQKQLISSILGSSWLEDITCIDEAITIICERLRGRKVLLLLDDVSHWNQLKALVGEKGWFGVGNLVIITSRNADILTKWDNKLVYELKELDWDQSFRLICLHAFGRGSTCQCELEPIAKEIVSMTGGLPLSIEVIGSLLFAKTRDSWEDTLKILKRTPNDEVMEKLRISYDSLKHAEKQIFLDIACLSFEAKKELAYYVWEACGFCPRE